LAAERGIRAGVIYGRQKDARATLVVARSWQMDALHDAFYQSGQRHAGRPQGSPLQRDARARVL